MPPKAKSTPAPVAETIAILRQHAEDQFAQELAELSHTDTRQRPRTGTYLPGQWPLI